MTEPRRFKVLRSTTGIGRDELCMTYDPCVEAHRQFLLSRHPLKLRDYMIPTPAVCNSLAKSFRLIDARMSGGAFVANPRFGKSTAIDYLLAVVERELPGHAFMMFGARDRKQSDPAFAYTDVLRARGSRLALKGSADDRFERAVKALWLAAAERNTDHVVGVIDEAQRYTESELDGLLAISNELQRHWKIRMTTLLWGQRSLEHKITALQSTHRTDLTGRFMPWLFVFSGVTGVGELQKILRMLDDDSEFPEGSGWSYVRLHFPKAVANGFRLSDFAAPLWSAFTKEAVAYSKRLEIGMEWISLALEDLLVRNSCDDNDRWTPTEARLQEAVQSSGFAHAIGHTYVPQDAAGAGGES